MNFDEIRDYWDDRAANDTGAQSTTQDVFLREIEYNVLSKEIEKFSPSSVADVGCGDGRTTLRLAQQFPKISFHGFDYSSSMIENARANANSMGVSNIQFGHGDICEGLEGVFDAVYTTRCLINLPSTDLQNTALNNIHKSLSGDGFYFMIENFIEGHDNFNRVRESFELPKIPVRDHNFFFDMNTLNKNIAGKFNVSKELNISSSYYLASRVIYSKICSENGTQPDYFDDHHKYASMLPFTGEFGPVRLVCLEKMGKF